MKILVPVKRVADPNNANKMKVSADGKQVTSGDLPWAVNPFDEYALEAALRLLENGDSGERTGEIVIVSLGPDEVQTTMRQALAMGADRAIHVKAEDGQIDSLIVAKTLKGIVDAEKPDLVLMGKQAVDGDSNSAGQMLAELLDWPMATFAMSLQTVDAQGSPAPLSETKALLVGREVDTGVLTLKVTLPAVVTVDLRIVQSKAVKNGITPATHAYSDDIRHIAVKGIMAAKKKPLESKTLADFGVSASSTVTYTKFVLPAARTGNTRYVESVSELVKLLRTDAKVL